MGDARTTVMGCNLKTRETKMSHYFDLIKRHQALGIPYVISAAVWLA